MITGTPYFQSRLDAIRYYKPYGYDDIDQAVQDKIDAKEIFICQRPPHKENEIVTFNIHEGRYFIETK